MSGHIHWSSTNQKFGREMILWNSLSRILQQENMPCFDDAKQIVILAQNQGFQEASQRLEDEGYCSVQELIEDSDYILAIDKSENILLNMSDTPEQRKAVKEICHAVTEAFEEYATKATNSLQAKP